MNEIILQGPQAHPLVIATSTVAASRSCTYYIATQNKTKTNNNTNQHSRPQKGRGGRYKPAAVWTHRVPLWSPSGYDAPTGACEDTPGFCTACHTHCKGGFPPLRGRALRTMKSGTLARTGWSAGPQDSGKPSFPPEPILWWWYEQQELVARTVAKAGTWRSSSDAAEALWTLIPSWRRAWTVAGVVGVGVVVGWKTSLSYRKIDLVD